MIQNNKLNITFNYDKINEDFDIYVIYKNQGDFFKSNILDIPNNQLNARSVVYTFGTKWYILFKKNEIRFEELKVILDKIDEEIFVEKVESVCEGKIYKNILAQLLFNTLGAPKNITLQYNNIAGKLYYFHSDWMKKFPSSFYGLQINLTYDLFVNLEVKTFSKLNEYHINKIFPQYIFDPNSGRFRRKLKSDINIENIYGLKNLTKKKNKINFLDFSNYDKFCCSKVGVFTQFMKDIKENLSEYLVVTSDSYTDYESVSLADLDFSTKTLGELLLNRPIYLVDEVNTEESQNLCSCIKSYLKQKPFEVDCIEHEMDREAFNIRIIRNSTYYSENELQDPYKNVSNEFIVQHITLDDFVCSKATIRKVILELLIKNDLQAGRLVNINWSNVYSSKWNFVQRQKITNEQGKIEYNYYKLSIASNGNLDFDSYNSEEFSLLDEWNIIEDIYKEADNKYQQIEGLIYQDLDNINIISRTNQYTFPNYLNLSNVLEMTSKSKSIDILLLQEYANQFLIDNNQFTEQVTSFINQLKALNNHCPTYAEILPLLNIKSKFGKIFNQYFYQNSGILLHPTLKDKSVSDDYFSAILDIKKFNSDTGVYYFVGTTKKSLQTSLHNACLVRKITSTGDTIYSKELLQMMAVEFVRNGQYTVYPFPFKYLNEYILNTNRI